MHGRAWQTADGGGDLEMAKLPEGWESYIDEASGAPVYWNAATGEQQWERPVDPNAVASATAAKAAGAGGGLAVLGGLFRNPLSKGKAAKKSKGGGHTRNETVLPPEWGKDVDIDGNQYYFGPGGETSWVPPPGSKGGSAEPAGATETLVDEAHVRSETQLPNGWEKDFDADGNKFYYDESGACVWDPPEGSTGGSAAAL